KRNMDHFADCMFRSRRPAFALWMTPARVTSEPEALLAVLNNPAYQFKRIGLEAGPLSQWALQRSRRKRVIGCLCRNAAHAGGAEGADHQDRQQLLYQAAQSMLRSNKWSWLKAWAMQISKRRGIKKAIVALARRLAVIMHRIWVDGAEFRWTREQAA